MMIRIGRRIGFPIPFGPLLALSLVLGLQSFGLALPSHSEAAKLGRFLTAQDVAGRMVLDQNGQQIQLPTASDRHPELANGSTPTYLAIPLYGREHLPPAFPRSRRARSKGRTRPGRSTSDALVKLSLNSALSISRLAIIDTPNQNYLVEFVPGRAHSGSGLDKAVGTASGTVNELSRLLNTGTAPLTKLTQSGMNDLEKFLHISSKSSTLTPELEPRSPGPERTSAARRAP